MASDRYPTSTLLAHPSHVTRGKIDDKCVICRDRGLVRTPHDTIPSRATIVISHGGQVQLENSAGVTTHVVDAERPKWRSVPDGELALTCYAGPCSHDCHCDLPIGHEGLHEVHCGKWNLLCSFA